MKAIRLWGNSQLFTEANPAGKKKGKSSFRRAGASADEAGDYQDLRGRMSYDGNFMLGNIEINIKVVPRTKEENSKCGRVSKKSSSISNAHSACSQEYVPALIFWQKQFARLFVPLTSLLNSVCLQCKRVNMKN